jgi:hypothetical protein
MFIDYEAALHYMQGLVRDSAMIRPNPVLDMAIPFNKQNLHAVNAKSWVLTS